MIKLLALAPEDGWAFFSQADKIYLLRPPYTKERLAQVSEEIVDKAIFQHGFQACEETEFGSMADLIAHVERRFVEIETAQGKETPSPEELRELLEFATDDVLDIFLTRIEKELIPQGAFGPAQAIATDLLGLDRVVHNSSMLQRSLDILKKCKQGTDSRRALADEISRAGTAEWSKTFPNATKRYPVESIASRRDGVQQRGELMPLAS